MNDLSASEGRPAGSGSAGRAWELGAAGWARRGALAFPQKEKGIGWVLSGAYLAGATTAHSAPTTTGAGGNAKSRRQTQRRKGSGSGRRRNNEKSEVFHGTHFICPASRWPGVGSGTFRAVEGCQRVREPSLSPLLYKKYSTTPPHAGKYHCVVVGQIYGTNFFMAKWRPKKKALRWQSLAI
jgi:hypothetical protein